MKDLWSRLPTPVAIALVMVAVAAALPFALGSLLWLAMWGVKIISLLPWPTNMPCLDGADAC